MSAGVSGFIDYDDSGTPYMGLIFEESTMQVRVFLARKDNAANVASVLGRELSKIAEDLRKTPSKIMGVNGMVASDAAFRKS